MNITELLRSGMQVDVRVSLMDLKEFALELIEEGKRQAEATPNTVDAELSASEVCSQLNVTKGTLWRWEKNGYLVPCGRVGRYPVYRQSQIDKLKN